MRKKAMLWLVCCMLIGAAILTGCSQKNENGQGEGGKVKLTAIITKHPLTKPLAEMEWLQAAEERAGVDIEWQEITADWGQKKGAMLASGDVPDLFVGPNVITDADIAQFQGLFQDLSELMEHAPNV